jgi:putative transposase
MMRYLPANGTAGLARFCERRLNRSPWPPARITASTLLIALLILSVGSEDLLRYSTKVWAECPWLETFRAVQQALSAPCFCEGTPLNALRLQRLMYHLVKGKLNAQMTISAIRLVAGAYHSAKSNKKPATRPFLFRRARALFLIGKRGRDADFRSNGTLSIWTVGGRKYLTYRIPEDFKTTFARAKEIDSLTVISRGGKLLGRVTLTLEVADPQGILPVGIDLNETNALVAVDPDSRELFVSGKAVKVKNRRTAKTRARLQSKHATRKAERKDTRSVRRLLYQKG